MVQTQQSSKSFLLDNLPVARVTHQRRMLAGVLLVLPLHLTDIGAIAEHGMHAGTRELRRGVAVDSTLVKHRGAHAIDHVGAGGELFKLPRDIRAVALA